MSTNIVILTVCFLVILWAIYQRHLNVKLRAFYYELCDISKEDELLVFRVKYKKFYQRHSWFIPIDIANSMNDFIQLKGSIIKAHEEETLKMQWERARQR